MSYSYQFDDHTNQGKAIKRNFQHQIIAPTIYSPENFQIIMNNYTGPKPLRKIYEAKKSKVQSVVEQIVSKKTIDINKKQATYQQKPNKLYKPIKQKPKDNKLPYQLDNMVMDLDEKINEKALFLDEEFSTQKAVLNQILQKIDKFSSNILNSNTQEQVQFYLTSVEPKKNGGRKILVRPESPKQVEKFVETCVKKQVSRYNTPANKTVKSQTTRPQTGTYKLNENEEAFSPHKNKMSYTQTMKSRQLRPCTSKSLTKYSSKQKVLSPYQLIHRKNSLTNTRLSRYEIGRQYKENIKHVSKNEEENRKFDELSNKIEIEALQNSLDKDELEGILSKLGTVWKTQKQFMESNSNKVLMLTKPNVLQMLQARRKKQNGYNNIDNIFMTKN